MIFETYRAGRVLFRQIIGREPKIKCRRLASLEYHGGSPYGGWAIPRGIVKQESTVIDVGLGEDISFSDSIINAYGCHVYGFDPTPKSLDYLAKRAPPKLTVIPMGLGGSTREVCFHLPNNDSHVSGSISRTVNTGRKTVNVKLLDLSDMLGMIGVAAVDVLKIDIEGAEYELIESEAFTKLSPVIKIICVEFHHRWEIFGPEATNKAVEKLKSLGFQCIWKSRQTNEEFTFLNMNCA